MKVFLSYSFGDGDRGLVAKIEALLSTHGIPIVTGDRLGGGPLTPEITRRIESADALIALMTRREELGGAGSGRWITHPWVRDELNHARGKDMRTIAVIEDEVELDGAYGEYERIPLTRDDPLEALLALSQTIRLWKAEVGLSRRIQIKPDEIGRIIRTTQGLRCRYRFVSPEGVRTDWKDSEPVLQPNGTILYVSGVRGEDHFIEVEVTRGDSMEWWSPAIPQLISVDLKRKDEQPPP